VVEEGDGDGRAIINGGGAWSASGDSEELGEGDHRTGPGSLEQFIEQVKRVLWGEVSRGVTLSDEPLQLLARAVVHPPTPWTPSVVTVASGSMRAPPRRAGAHLPR
jgi:hypothetical protein